MGIAYSLFLQYLVILDAFTIAAGFVLRIMAGGYASNTEVSSWLLLTTFLLSVLLAFGKRRYELSIAGQSKPFRKVLKEYNDRFLDSGIIIFATTAIVTFSIYAVEIGKKEFVVSVPFACYGVLRYLQIVQRENGVDPTDAFIKDRALFVAVFLWIFVTALIVYFNDIMGLLR
jgi:4-hydroxybenzoate polyprenyltransferase